MPQAFGTASPHTLPATLRALHQAPFCPSMRQLSTASFSQSLFTAITALRAGRAAGRAVRSALVLTMVLGVVACSGGGGSSDNFLDANGGLLVQGNVPLVYAKRSTAVSLSPTDGTGFAPGGDLMLREQASPSAREHNLTAAITQGQGDVSGPEVSYDAKKIVFALRCPTSNTATTTTAAGSVPACTGRWNIWEYDLGDGRSAAGSLRRITSSSTADDLDPAYLPNNRGFVFTSNRQARSSQAAPLGRGYRALDEDQRQPTLNLHTMNAAGAGIAQITFNMSHDRNPVLRANGEILFSRWGHAADSNRYAIYRVRPDGTDHGVVYGEHSAGTSFLHPREADPRGRYAGMLTSSLVPLSRTQEGGSLQFIAATDYTDSNTPVLRSSPDQGGQFEPTTRALNSDLGFSDWGRVTTPFPLWDGTDRVLLAYRPCEVTRSAVVVSCANLTPAERALLADTTRSATQRATDAVKDDVPAAYAVYMYDPQAQTWLIVAAPPTGFMHTDPVPLQARSEPTVLSALSQDVFAAAENLGVLEVRSVYDTDSLGRMAEGQLVAADRAADCAFGIAVTANVNSQDARAMVPDIASIQNPADPAYRCSPVRFVRVLRALPTPAGVIGARRALGETDFSMQQIVGYAPIEPDGSFKLKLPADTPLALQVLDAQGRAFQTHSNWIALRAGEKLSCNGCHSPTRGTSLNSGPLTNSSPPALRTVWTAQRQSGETLAAVRARIEPGRLTPSATPVFVDDWAETQLTGVTARPSIALRYTGNSNPADDLGTPAPSNGVINYPEHIQPLWTRSRGAGGAQTCTNCHNISARLDLRAAVDGSGRLRSYQQLVLGEVQRDTAGLPITRVVEGVRQAVRTPALVETSASVANHAGQARKSRLTEILFGQALLAPAAARTAHPNPPATAPNHANLLGKAEKRLLAEWMDLGAQYYNDPTHPGAAMRAVAPLSLASFATEVAPVLQERCLSCHAPGQGFVGNRFVLTGQPEGDYHASLAQIQDTCIAGNNPLLAQPAALAHPGGLLGGVAVLPVGSTAYGRVAAWIARGCGGN